MIRRIFAIILLLIVMVLLFAVGVVFAATPPGARILATIGTPTPPAPTPKPVLSVHGTHPPTVTAKAAYLLDADSGHVLVNIQGQQRLPMASTTKIMTALITIETADLDKVVTIQKDAVTEVTKNNGSSAQLIAGDQIRLKDLLYGLMLPSGDDAAIAIADAVAGSPAKFVDTMNLYAQRLHLTNTHYNNPDGLTYLTAQGKPNPTHYSSAADLVQLTRIALNNPLFAQIVELQHYAIPPTATHHRYIWDTTNNLLKLYAGTTGIKTGSTPEAGYCLVFAATSAGHHLIGATLNDKDDNQRLIDAETLLDWGFALPLLPPTSP